MAKIIKTVFEYHDFNLPLITVKLPHTIHTYLELKYTFDFQVDTGRKASADQVIVSTCVPAKDVGKIFRGETAVFPSKDGKVIPETIPELGVKPFNGVSEALSNHEEAYLEIINGY